MRRVFSAAVMMLAASGLGARPPVEDSQDLKGLYARSCAVCHGEDGSGRTANGQKLGGRDLANPRWQVRVSDQRSAPHEVRMTRREQEHEPAAERVADPERRLGKRLGEVGDVLREGPRRLPARAAVPAQVGSEHVEPRRPPLLRELLEALAVRGHAVQADDGRILRVAPLVHVELHRQTVIAAAP